MGIEELFDGSMGAEAAAPETPAEVVETPVAEPAPETVQEEATPQVETPPATPATEEPRHVPLATFLDARDEAKELKRRVAEYEAREAASKQRTDAPDPYDDPNGFAAFQNAQVQEALTAQKFAMSDMMARQQHGAETVEAAGAWAMERAKTDPVFAASYMREQHPIDWIVQQHKRDELLKQIGDNPDEWVKRRYAELAPPAPIAAAPVAAQQQPASVPTPPRSLASAPGSGGGVKDVPIGGLSALEAVFTR
jgi:hypothetical protein